MRPRHRPVPPVPDVVTAQVLQLYREVTSGQTITRVLGISRNTVRRLVEGHERRVSWVSAQELGERAGVLIEPRRSRRRQGWQRAGTRRVAE